MKKLPSINAAIFGVVSCILLPTHMAPAGEADVDVLAVQSGLLASSGFGNGKGELPNELRSHGSNLGDWASGTGVLLRTKPPEGAKPALNEFKLISFTDDGGKDLTKAPEGMQAERFGREFKPVDAAYDEKNGELYIAVRSRRAPSREATMVQGEVQIALDGGREIFESGLFNPTSRGSEVKVGSFILEIGYYGPVRQERNSHGGAPQGMFTPPPPPADAKEFSYTINVEENSGEKSAIKVVAVELVSSSGKQIFKHDNFDFQSRGSFSTSFQDSPPFKFRITTTDTTKMKSYPLTFKTTIGVSE